MREPPAAEKAAGLEEARLAAALETIEKMRLRCAAALETIEKMRVRCLAVEEARLAAEADKAAALEEARLAAEAEKDKTATTRADRAKQKAQKASDVAERADAAAKVAIEAQNLNLAERDLLHRASIGKPAEDRRRILEAAKAFDAASMTAEEDYTKAKKVRATAFARAAWWRVKAVEAEQEALEEALEEAHLPEEVVRKQ